MAQPSIANLRANKNREYMRRWRDANREQYDAGQRSRHLARTYGISLEQYDEMLLRQNGVCAICGRTETKVMKGTSCALAVDHDHDTGRVRGLLCDSCNAGLGKLGDDIERLRAALRYLEVHSG